MRYSRYSVQLATLCQPVAAPAVLLPPGAAGPLLPLLLLPPLLPLLPSFTALSRRLLLRRHWHQGCSCPGPHRLQLRSTGDVTLAKPVPAGPHACTSSETVRHFSTMVEKCGLPICCRGL